MIYKAEKLRLLLTHLTLTGQSEDGRLEFIGTDHQWSLTK